MKEGDKFYWFDGEKICEALIQNQEPDAVFCFPKPAPIFPTREALCEHYRKIFE